MTTLPQQREALASLADLYAGLAEALSTDRTRPAWLGRPGKEWPLWHPASRLAAQTHWPQLSEAVGMLAEVPHASPSSRQLAYQMLLMGNGRAAPIMLYQSQYTNGRFLGPETFALQALYREAGLEPAGAELPDYAAVELEFLSFLVEREEEDAGRAGQWRAARRRFLALHAGRWLPQVGRRLIQSGDPAWAAVGGMLVAALNPPRKQRAARHKPAGLPRILNPQACTLCGFCIQVCPTHALLMQEDNLATRLTLTPSLCIHCHKCERVCQEQAMDLLGEPVTATALVLRQSSRATCSRCGQPTVSQAEISAIVGRLGEHPAWLDYCLQCR